MTDKTGNKVSRLKQRRVANVVETVDEVSDSADSAKTVKEEVVWGKTPDGTGSSTDQ